MRTSRTRCGLALAALLTVGAGCQVMLTGVQDRENRYVRYTDRGVEAQGRVTGRGLNTDANLRRARALAEHPRSPEPGKKLRFLLFGLHAYRLYAIDHTVGDEQRAEARGWYERARVLARTEAGKRGRNTARSQFVPIATGFETPRDVDIVYGAFLVETGRPGEALRVLEPIVAADPKLEDFELWSSLALARLSRGDLAGAEAAFARVPPGAVATSRTTPMLQFGQLRRRFLALSQPENHADGRVDSAQLLALWKQIDALAVGLSKSYRAYLEGARTFADVGEIEVAKGLLRTAARATRVDGGEAGGKLEQLCAAAYVTAAAGESFAAKSADGCVAGSTRSRRPLSIGERTLFAGAYTAAGRTDEAIALLEPAVAELEATRASFPVEERAQFFRTAARRSYWALIRAHGTRAAARGETDGRADLEAALRVTEQVRARQLGEVLGDRGREIAAFKDLEQVRGRLAEAESLLSFVVTERDILVVAVDRARWRFARLDLGAAELARVTGIIAKGLSRPDSDQARLAEHLTLLGRALLRPVHDVVAGARTLTVLPDGVMNTVPFDLLSVDATWRPLLDHVTVRVTPSLGFYLTPRKARAVQQGFFAVGDPVMPEGIPALPETRTEITRIAALFGDRSRLLLAGEARESEIKRAALGEFGAVHLATHGILGRELPGVTEPALILSPETGEDGMLTASEVAALRIDAEIAVLSACKTGLGDMSSGEGVFGMSRAFLLAGTSAVIVSLWSVDSRATEELMVAFYGALQRETGPYEALRAAKLALRGGQADGGAGTRGLEVASDEPGPGATKASTGKATKAAPPPPVTTPARWAHPYYWGAFQLVGR